MSQQVWRDRFLLTDDVRHMIGESLVILTPVKGMNQIRSLIITEGLIVFTTRSHTPEIALSHARAYIDEHARLIVRQQPTRRWEIPHAAGLSA